MNKLLQLVNPRVDANDGVITTNEPRIGNREFGDAVFLTGATRPIPTTEMTASWDGFESITVSNSVIRLSIAEVTDHDMATIDIEDAAVRVRVDGVDDPSATVGRPFEAGDEIKLTDPAELANFRAIRRDGTDATFRVTYGYRRVT